MYWDDERAAFESRLSDNFSATPIQFSGVPFTPPKAGAWVRIKVLPTSTHRVSLGPNERVRIMGLLVLSIFTPAKTGSSAARVLADELTDVFNEAQFSYNNSGSILCRRPSLVDQGTQEGDVYYRVDLLTEFQRDVLV